MAQIFLIEDDAILRGHIEEYLQRNGHSVRLASDGEDALTNLDQLVCDVVIADVKLPKRSGIEVLKKITQHFIPHPPVILMTGHGDKSMAIEALRFGASDLLEKPFAPQLLIETIERLLKDKKQEIARFKAAQTNAANCNLTLREKEIASLASIGLSNEEVAERLRIGAETVKSHLKNIFRKLGVPNRAALASLWSM